MCPCAAVRRVGRGDDSGVLPGADGWERGATVRSVWRRAFYRTDRPICPGQATSDAARPRAGQPGRDASGGLRGVSPQDDIPKSSRAWGCPPRSPGAGGHAHPLSARARHHGRVLRRNCLFGLRVQSDSRGARRAMTTARRSPASHALHCLRLPGRRSGSQSAQSWPISAHLRRDCERSIMAMNRWLPVTAHGGELCHVPRCSSCPVFTRNLRRSSGTAGEQTASQHPW